MVSKISKKRGSNGSKMFKPSIKSMDTKSSNMLDFKHLNHAFTPTADFEGYRISTKEEHENATDLLEGNPELQHEDHRQMPDHPNTFMNTIKARAMARTGTNDGRRQVFNP
jgi:hypothetical protein